MVVLVVVCVAAEAVVVVEVDAVELVEVLLVEVTVVTLCGRCGFVRTVVQMRRRWRRWHTRTGFLAVCASPRLAADERRGGERARHERHEEPPQVNRPLGSSKSPVPESYREMPGNGPPGSTAVGSPPSQLEIASE